MTSAEAVERALRLIVPAPPVVEQTHLRTMLNVLIKDARTELATQTAGSTDRQQRELLRKTFPNVNSDAGGLAPLTALIEAPEPLLLKFLNTAEIHLAGIPRRLTLLPDESAVKLDRTPGFPFGTLIGTSLLVYNGGQPFDGDVSIRGPFIPELENLETELEEPFVLILHSMATKKVPSSQRTMKQEAQVVAE